MSDSDTELLIDHAGLDTDIEELMSFTIIFSK
jgi:hypothetical protein